jgi:hypothetical protein
VRASQNSAQVSVQGNDYTIQSNQPIPANISFAIQVPFGAGVGVAGNNNGNTGNNGNLGGAAAPFAPEPLPTDQSGVSFGLPSFGTICGILCIVGILVLLGGGGLLRGLLGGLLGGGSRGYTAGSPGGGSFPGTSNTGGGGSFFGSGGSAGRGFRQSGNQSRNVGRVGDDKDSGGGASFN